MIILLLPHFVGIALSTVEEADFNSIGALKQSALGITLFL